MGILSSLFRTNKLNAEAVQQEMARFIIDVAEHRKAPVDLVRFLTSQGWSRSDARGRFLHALSMARIWRADLWPAMKAMGQIMDASIAAAPSREDPRPTGTRCIPVGQELELDANLTREACSIADRLGFGYAIEDRWGN